MNSDASDISEMSKSPKRNCRQNISDGWIWLGIRRMPRADTRPSRSGRVRSLSESAILASTTGALMRQSIRPAAAFSPFRHQFLRHDLPPIGVTIDDIVVGA